MREDLDFIASLLGIPRTKALRLAFYGFYWEGLPEGKKAKKELRRLEEKYKREEIAYYEKEDGRKYRSAAKGEP